jgi:hypothetical protein
MGKSRLNLVGRSYSSQPDNPINAKYIGRRLSPHHSSAQPPPAAQPFSFVLSSIHCVAIQRISATLYKEKLFKQQFLPLYICRVSKYKRRSRLPVRANRYFV